MAALRRTPSEAHDSEQVEDSSGQLKRWCVELDPFRRVPNLLQKST